MASRRDELNAYTFAKKRMVAAFLQPSSAATEEGTPSPLRAVVPGLVTGALLLAGFGAWGLLKPTAPKGWDKPRAHVIVGSSSTTRYVILETDGKPQLHPVLNLASAKLLLDPGQSSIIRVKDSVLDNGHITRGPTIGIPYAPDRMPSADEAGKRKRWAVCEQPGGDQANQTTQKAVFLFAGREADKVEGPQRLHGSQALYVQGPGENGPRYLVDSAGTKYLLRGPGSAQGRQALDDPRYNLLLRTVFADGAQPQQVTQDWLDTLNDGSPVEFPVVPGEVGADAGVPGLGEANRVGRVLETRNATAIQHYVVLRGKVQRVSDFVANLLLSSDQLKDLNPGGTPEQVNSAQFTSDTTGEFYGSARWPREVPRQANSADPAGGDGARDTVCSILTGVRSDGTTQVATWAGRDYPAAIVDGATSAYVTPGTGLLYRQFQGTSTGTGLTFLVTDTGLRYQVQANNDSTSGKSKIGAERKDPGAPEGAQEPVNQAQARLGYQDVRPVPVPVKWSQFLPVGPRLDTNSARRPQGS
ncbi:type VII secretion protein EccB [Streptomyces sp. B1866]|uniref:type VII secretion protein EccB n=1 Tax=Streptomyces sp. B1866 TaxID=3075431 RepID=UPI00288E18B2|nr:type VII secretion protein EccB [Streptomyces sp. B1866]MDT3398193.1 type VII secretion protein EccB [Streptomyces sp. B1866]